jgi:hypothetical protein
MFHSPSTWCTYGSHGPIPMAKAICLAQVPKRSCISTWTWWFLRSSPVGSTWTLLSPWKDSYQCPPDLLQTSNVKAMILNEIIRSMVKKKRCVIWSSIAECESLGWVCRWIDDHLRIWVYHPTFDTQHVESTTLPCPWHWWWVQMSRVKW